MNLTELVVALFILVTMTITIAVSYKNPDERLAAEKAQAARNAPVATVRAPRQVTRPLAATSLMPAPRP